MARVGLSERELLRRYAHPALLACPEPFAPTPLPPTATAVQRDGLLVLRLGQVGEALDECGLFLLTAQGSSREVVVGRSAIKSDVALPEPTISKRHARLRALPGMRYTVTDLESANGSYLEELKLPTGAETPLYGGSALRLSELSTLFLEPAQVARLLTDSTGEEQVWPDKGCSIKSLAARFKGLTLEEFRESYPAPFLLQVPTESLGDVAERTQDGQGVTLAVSRTKLLRQERRREHLSQALVHYLGVAGQEDTAGVVVGRAEGRADLVIPEPSASKRHAELRVDSEGSWSVLDLESQNGTWVEKERLPAGILRPLTWGQSLAFAGYRCLLLESKRIYELVTVLGKRKGSR